MGLGMAEQRTLAQIESSLCKSDPELAAMLAVFNHISSSEPGPGTERLCPWRPRVSMALSLVLVVLAIVLVLAGVALLCRGSGRDPGLPAAVLVILPGAILPTGIPRPGWRPLAGRT